MARIPVHPKVYHITHLDNLAQIMAAGMLLSDAHRIARGLDCEIVGMNKIKRRRLEDLDVSCHPGTLVGEYVPFYFCPRSIMLYLIHRGNHPDLNYRGGQRPIVHLESDLGRAVAWAEGNSRRWAFTNCTAGAAYADFFCDLGDLDEINWDAVGATDFRPMIVKDGKQAEFLVHESFPWELIERIGVVNARVERRVTETLRDARHNPLVSVERGWYY